MLSIFLLIENDDERALAESLYLTYKSKMYGIAYAILRRREDAEDSVMDAVCRIVENISIFIKADRNKTESLIVIISRNTAINRYNYNKYRDHLPTEGTEELLADNEPLPAEIIIAEEDYEALLSKIRALDPIYRDVLLLKYLYEYDNGAIASLLGVSESTVRVRLMRAREHLRKILSGGGAD